MVIIVFFFNDTATTEIYTLSLHDALPISGYDGQASLGNRHSRLFGQNLNEWAEAGDVRGLKMTTAKYGADRSEEHTSELQSRQYLVCRLLLEKKKTT